MAVPDNTDPKQEPVATASDSNNKPDGAVPPASVTIDPAEYEKLKTQNADLSSQIQLVDAKNKELKTEKDKAKAAEAEKRTEAQQAMEANNEHKALAESLKIDITERDETIADLRKQVSEANNTKTKFDEINERAKASVEATLKKLSKDKIAQLKEFYRDWETQNAVDQNINLNTFTKMFAKNGTDMPGGAGQASTTDMVTLKAEAHKGPVEMATYKQALRQAMNPK